MDEVNLLGTEEHAPLSVIHKELCEEVGFTEEVIPPKAASGDGAVSTAGLRTPQKPEEALRGFSANSALKAVTEVRPVLIA